ncbi:MULTISPECIES: hypothetical protein [unclassified Rhizobium]|uniref:hypothetical protein n=1 Tax=unclassified Rhizobium TaxID=2613769 RepID=UPI0012DDC8CD|nr:MULTISPECIES: hypothetical protein [unclassified Rhizobium]
MSAVDRGSQQASAVEGTARARRSGWKGQISIDCKWKVMVPIFWQAFHARSFAKTAIPQ